MEIIEIWDWEASLSLWDAVDLDVEIYKIFLESGTF